MITVDEARALIRQRAVPLPPERMRLSRALGCRLAETIVADADSPPFDKAVVDGFAVGSSALTGPGPHRLRIVEEITAGRVSERAIGPGETAAIMTGAPLPRGADAVVMVETTSRIAADLVEISGPIVAGSGWMARGREMLSGQPLFRPGAVLSPAALGVIAGVGKADVLAIPRPRVAIVPTGDELVPPHATPGPGQIRETNSTILSGLVAGRHCQAAVYPIVRDDPAALRTDFEAVLRDEPDLLVICGGVSAGTKDLVPAVLAELGFETVFHKVRLKPGKPLLFAIGPPRGNRPPMLAFGLPGNPVSSLVGHLLFVDVAMSRLHGDTWDQPASQILPLAAPFRHRGERPTYHVSRVVDFEGSPGALPLEWAGSSDLLRVAEASGFIRFPAGDRQYEVGEAVEYLPLPFGAA